MTDSSHEPASRFSIDPAVADLDESFKHGEEHMPEDKTPSIREYSTPDVTVTWEPGRCIHAGECVRGLPTVFERDRRPWIDPTAAAADRIVAVIDRCPSYALGYRAADGRIRTAPKP